MNTVFVPGPDDEFRGVIEFDFTEHLTPEERANVRITRLVDEPDSLGVFEFDFGPPPPDAAFTPVPPPRPVEDTPRTPN